MNLVLCTSIALLAADLKSPPGCIVAERAVLAEHGYADRVIHEKTGSELVFIPAGPFTMGPDDRNAAAQTTPARQVTITRPFYLGKTEVTNGQFRRFTKANPAYDGKADVDPNYDLYLRHFRGKSVMSAADPFPVVYVSWHNANAFCVWAGLALPSEAQWEYACAAGTTTRFSFGDDLADLHRYAWVDLAAGHRTHPVATKRPNPWGLYDMHGNVWEWCADDYIDQYRDAPPDETRRRNPHSQTKPLRGGSWSTGPSRSLERTPSWWFSTAVGTISRFHVAPGNAHHDRGFRVLLPLSDIAPLAPLPNVDRPTPDGGIIARFTFEEGGGTTVRDTSGRGNHGTNRGARYVKRKEGQGFALAFDSLKSTVDFGDRPDLNLRSHLTLEMWLNPQQLVASREIGILGKGFGSFAISLTQNIWFYIGNGSTFVTAPIARNRWHHVVASYDRQTMRLYLDGKQAGRKPLDHPVPQGARFFLRPPLPGDRAIDQPWSFMVDDVRIYNRTLTANEVLRHYQKEAHR